MKRIITLLASAALVASGLSIVPAVASEPPPTVPAVVNIEDPAGDANYVNGQGFDETQGDKSTPADLGSLSDILKVWFTSDASTIRAHIQTEAAASGNNVAIFFRVMADPAGVEANCLRFQGMTGGLNTPDAAFGSLRDLCGSEDKTYSEGIEFKIDTGPDDTGIYTISVPRSTHPAFAEGTNLLAPTAHSRNFIGGGGAGATVPQVDNTKPGLDFVVTAGEGAEDVKPTPPGKNDPPGKKKGCAKGKGKKRGCEGKGKKAPKPGKPSNSCTPYAPGEMGKDAETTVVTDAATEDKPIEIDVPLGPATGTVGSDRTTRMKHNVQVDTTNEDVGMFARLEGPALDDPDLYVYWPGGSRAAVAGGFNPLLAAGPLPEAHPILAALNGTGSGGHSEFTAEQIDGLRTSDCQGWTLDLVNWAGRGGYTLTLWLGEVQNEPAAEE